jgi:hypothetical protein
MLRAFDSVALPPPGGEFVTTTFLVPMAASAAMVIAATICVRLLNVRELTVIPDPKLTLVVPVEKFVPMSVTFSTCPLELTTGEMLPIVGAAFSTLKAKASVALPPPGAELVTTTLLEAKSASEAMLMLAVMLPAVLTVTEFTVTPGPKLTLLTPAIKFDPTKETLSVCPRAPTAGLILETVGTGFPTVKPLDNVIDPPPGAEFVTVTFLVPATVPGPIVRFAVRCVPPVSTVTELTTIPEPKSTLLAPLRKSDPLSTTLSV